MERQTAGVVDIILYPSQVKQKTHNCYFLNFTFGEKEQNLHLNKAVHLGVPLKYKKCSNVILQKKKKIHAEIVEEINKKYERKERKY
jgi:hypothetical protein